MSDLPVGIDHFDNEQVGGESIKPIKTTVGQDCSVRRVEIPADHILVFPFGNLLPEMLARWEVVRKEFPADPRAHQKHLFLASRFASAVDAVPSDVFPGSILKAGGEHGDTGCVPGK